jgi:hypothetical protein
MIEIQPDCVVVDTVLSVKHLRVLVDTSGPYPKRFSSGQGTTNSVKAQPTLKNRTVFDA